MARFQSLFASLLPFILAPCLVHDAAAGTTRVSLEAQPVAASPAPEAGRWSLESAGDLRATASDSVLQPVVRPGEDGARLSVTLPGGGVLTMDGRGLSGAAGELAHEPRTERWLLPPAFGPARRLVLDAEVGFLDETFELRPGTLKHDLVVPRDAHERLGRGALTASWRLELPKGLGAKLEPGEGLVLRDAAGAFVARVPEPLVSDARGGHAEAAASLAWDGQTLGVLVDGEWLDAPEREWPVRIDPTVTIFPAFNSRTGWVDESGFKSSGAIDSGSLADVGFGFDVRGFAEFDTSPIPDTATILDVELEVWLSNHDNPLDPAVPLLMKIQQVNERASASAFALHAAIPPLAGGPTYASEDLPRTGSRFCPDSYEFRTYDLGPLADMDLQLRLSADWFTIGFVSEIVTDPLFDHVDYIGFPETVQNSDCPTQAFPGTRIRLNVEYSDDLPPECDAGGPYLAECPDGDVFLDGGASEDPEGAPLSWSWTTDCPGELIDPGSREPLLLLEEDCSVSCTVELTVSDGVNESSCGATVNALDEQPPVLQGVPADEDADCGAVPPPVMPTAVDACDPAPELEYLGEERLDGPCEHEYELVRSWQAVDRCGNSTPVAQQTISVTDSTPPSLTGVPPTAYVSCSDVPPPASPTAEDDCDDAPEVLYLGEVRTDGDCPDRYELERSWQAVDDCGNASPVQTQLVVVSDDLAPLIRGLPADEVVGCGEVPPVAMPFASDDCDPDAVIEYLGEELIPGPCPDSHDLVRRWQAFDRCGNSSPIAEQRITVVDSDPPVLSGVPADEAVSCTGVPPVAMPTASDDCDPAPLVEYLGEERIDGPCEDSHQLVRRWQAFDRCGNPSPIAAQTITVSDSQPPVLAGVPVDEAVGCGGVPPVAAPTASDDCDPDPVVEYLGEERIDGPCPDSYQLVRRWRALDRCANASAISEQTITVTDAVAPALSAVPADAEVSCDAVPPVGAPSASDDCDPAPAVAYLGEERIDGPCEDSYQLIRRWQASDRCGNLSPIAEQVIAVSDALAPVLAGVPADAVVSCDAVPPVAMPMASDDCDPGPTVQYLGEERLDGACPDDYQLIRRWQGSDRCGNLSPIAEQSILVSDSQAPVLSGVPADASADCASVPPPAAVGALDDCDPAPSVAFAELRTDGDCPGSFTLTRTWTATDRCGNSSAAAQVITVTDTTPPVVSASDETVACLWPPNHRYVPVDASALELSVSDDCSEPVEWRIVGCSSDQPDDARESDPDSPWNGDGRTIEDCIVSADGRTVFARAERAGSGPRAQEGRTYSLLVVAVDACGNESEAVPAGRIHVPHDQSPRERGCLDSTKLGLKRSEEPPR